MGRAARFATLLPALVLALGGAACSVEPAGSDGARDPGRDGAEVPGDLPADGAPDVPPDAAPDAPRDPGPDGASDLPPADLPPDAADLPADPAGDPAGDPAPDGAADLPGPDPFADPGPDVPSFALVTGGQSSHVIVVADDASPSEKAAAAELAALFLQATGATLPVVAAPPAEDTPRIVVGQGAAAKALGVDPDPADLGGQGFVLKAVPPHVVVAGTPGAGTMYGVHRFAEEALGVRWTAPGVTTVPARPDATFPADAHRTVTPAFRWRHTSYEWPGGDRAFRAHQADNNGKAGVDDPLGLLMTQDGRAHSYFTYVSPDEFFDTHPEYFSEIGGVRIREDTQLCLTNPDVLDIVTERMLARMASMPDVYQHNFSQKDYYNVCQCPQCRAMNELYGTDGGTQFWFVSELAKRTSQVHPDKQIGTLAYMYTEEPPVGLEIHPNVAVWLCHMYPSCDSHPIRTCPKNADYRRRAEAWAALADHLYVWHYVVDFMHYYNPFPNLDALADNLRFYRDIGVEGVYLQGMGHDGGGGEFSLLRPYYGMKLLWDPAQDEGRIVREWLRDWHGDAWGPIHDWIRLIQDKVDRDGIHMHLYTNPAQGYLPEEIVAQGEALFAEARALVQDDPVLLDRVEVAAMPLTYARFFPRNGYRIEDGWLRWNPGMATFDDVLAFIDRMNAHGFKTMREVQGSPDTMTLLYAILGVDQEVKTIRNAALEVDVVPALAGRALRITDRASGRTVTAWDRRTNLFYPFGGGLEDRVGEGFNFFGWVEPGNASAVTETSVTVSLRTFDGWDLSRTVTLDPAEPVMRVTTTVRNPGTAAREARLRHHLEMDLGTLRTTRVAFTGLDGEAVDTDMAGVVAGMREGRHFRQRQVPDGAWTFTGDAGLALTHRFDPAKVDFAWLYAYPEEDRDLEMEVFGRRVLLQPGESLTMEQEIEVRPAP